MKDGDLPISDDAFPQEVYDSIGIYVSPNLTQLPPFSFGKGIIGRRIELLHSGIVAFDTNFLGDKELVQHVQSIGIIGIPAE